MTTVWRKIGSCKCISIFQLINQETGLKKTSSLYLILELAVISGDPICDLIPIHIDVFRGDPHLLKEFLESYRLPLGRKALHQKPAEGGSKLGRLSYITM